MIVSLVVLIAWTIGIPILGTYRVFGNGYIWTDGFSVADGDDLMAVAWLLGMAAIATITYRAAAR